MFSAISIKDRERVWLAKKVFQLQLLTELLLTALTAEFIARFRGGEIEIETTIFL